ncbi:MAG: hypothetical protein JWQ35_1872, partial [Bacteriovoracaceae bacterium]|nr:hypothetical protein [Bacteriovoracaceae bacterium]
MTGELGQSVISNSPQALKILNHPIAFEALWFSPKIKTMIAQLGLKIPEFRSELKFDSVTENLDYMNFYYDFYEEIKSRPALLQNFADWLLKVKEKYEAALIAAKSINPEFKQGYTNEQLFRAASDAVQFTSGLRNLPSNASDQIPLAERTKKLIDLNQPLEGEDLSPEELDDLVKENLKRAKRIPIEGEATQLPTKESLAAHFGNIMGEVEYKVFDAEEKRSALGSIPSQNRAAWFQAATDFMEAET